MTQLLTLTVTALVLAGCADGYDKSADTNACERSAPPDQQATWRMVEPSVVSLGMDMPSKKKATNTAVCGHNGGNGGNAPKIHDLQKIGAARSWDVV